MPMKNPPDPGLAVRHDCLEPLGLTLTEAAQRLGVSRERLSELVNGRSGISREMAIHLDRAFGGGAGAWYRLQSAYDLAHARKNAGRIQVKRIATPVRRSARSAAPVRRHRRRAIRRAARAPRRDDGPPYSNEKGLIGSAQADGT